LPWRVVRGTLRLMKQNMLGAYGPWAAALEGDGPRSLSFRNPRWSDVAEWRKTARAALEGLLLMPSEVRASDVRSVARYQDDDLEIEEISWRLPFGPRTGAYFLTPRSAKGLSRDGKLPGILAFHDHGGDKHFGKRKIVRFGKDAHPLAEKHQGEYYGGAAWANEAARRGFAVLVHDVFPFESRRIISSDLPGPVVRRLMSAPEELHELSPQDRARPDKGPDLEVPADEPEAAVASYNVFAGQHESVIAKSLFCAGLTWPGVALAEDRAALDYLASRPEVDPDRLGCGGLSGGGLRTVFLAGLDDRIKAAVCAGFMSTWEDFLLNTSYAHTWMMYVPGLARLMDFPEVLGLRAPLPSLVMATTEDPLFTHRETRRAARILEETYRKAGAADRLSVRIFSGPHKMDVPMQAEAFTWLEKWLA
jgi:dienelactone hydrolase